MGRHSAATGVWSPALRDHQHRLEPVPVTFALQLKTGSRSGRCPIWTGLPVAGPGTLRDGSIRQAIIRTAAPRPLRCNEISQPMSLKGRVSQAPVSVRRYVTARAMEEGPPRSASDGRAVRSYRVAAHRRRPPAHGPGGTPGLLNWLASRAREGSGGFGGGGFLFRDYQIATGRTHGVVR